MKSLTILLLALTAGAGAAGAAESAVFTTKLTGQGRPMILIPGLACPGDVWDSTVAHFETRFACHVISLAGFGDTPAAKPTNALLENVREDLAAYIRDRALDRPVIVGHSLGGFIALDLAARHPELAGELVIVDSLPFFMGIMRPDATAEDAQRIAQATAQGFMDMDAKSYAHMIRNGPNGSTMAASEADLNRIIQWGLASDSATVARAMTEMYSRDLRSDLASITAPTLVLAAWVGYAPYSSHDYIERTYREQYAALPNLRLAITDTARHFIMLDEPEWLFAQVETFLETPAR